MNPVFLSSSVYLHFGTSSVTTGAATNADSTPTVSVEENGALMGYAPSVTNVATGLYRVQIDATGANGFEAAKRYSVYAVATVGAITGRDGIAEFEVLSSDLDSLTTILARLPAALVGGRMDSSVGAMTAGVIAAATFAAGALDAVWSTAVRVLTAGTNIVLAKGVGVTGFNDISAADVNTQVLDVLNIDTFAEPGQTAPVANTTLVEKIGYLYKAWRNRTTQTATQYSLYDDAAATVDQKATFLDDGVTATRGEVSTGP